MFSSIGRYLTILACLVIGASSARSAVAQHHGSHHSSWQHFVPSFEHHGAPHHGGVYYTYGGANYYAPVAPQVQVLRPQISNAVPQPISPAAPLPSEPIAPQSVKLEFGGFKQTADLAGRLEFELNRLCLDMHYNYQHNPGFTKTYREAYQIMQIAKSVQSTLQRGDRAAISREANGLDARFHHVQDEIKPWKRAERRPVGEGGINGKAEVIEAILHHLLFDVGVKPVHSDAREEQAPPPAATDTPPAPAPAAPPR